MSRENTFPFAGKRGGSLTSSPLRASSLLTEIRCSLVVVTSTLERRSVLKLHKPGTVAIGQPWFYLRLAPRRGTMALLGYPREHTVPRETWRQRRTQPNPAKIITLEPERSEPSDYRGSDSGLVFRT